MMTSFKKISIAWKVRVAFSVTIILLLFLSVMAYQAMHSSSVGFLSYREMARDTNLAGRLQANMLMVRMNVKDYIITSSEKDQNEYNQYYKKTSQFMDESLNEIQKPSRAKIIKSVSQQLLKYDHAFNEVSALMKKRDFIVNNTLNVTGPKAEKKLSYILETAARDKDMSAAYNAGVATKHLLLARLYVAKFLDTNTQASIDRVDQEFNSLKSSLATLNKDLQNKGRRKALREVQKLQENYLSEFHNLTETIFARNKIIKGTLDKIGPKIAKDIESVKLDIKSVQDKIGPALQNSNISAENNILLISTIATLLGIFIAMFFTSYITKTISALSIELKDVAKNVLSIGHWVSDSARELLQSSDKQTSSLQTTASATTEISEMVKNNSTSAQDTTTIAADCMNETENGQKSLKSVQESIDKINENNEDLNANINESNEQVEGIVTIINEIVEKTQVINDIVFQTKLLSFNASVEAARAGEHGKGFAIVAEEVGNLASMSGKASAEISDLLLDSSKKVESIVSMSKEKTSKVMEQGKKCVNDGLERTRECGEVFSTVTKSFKEVNESVQNIAIASSEQSKGVQEISTSIQEFSSLINENSNSVRLLTTKADELKGYSGELSNFVERMHSFVYGEKENTLDKVTSPKSKTLQIKRKKQDDNSIKKAA